MQHNFSESQSFSGLDPCYRKPSSVTSIGFFFHSGTLSKDVIELIGVVEESYPNTTFRVRILSEEAQGHELHCHLAGRMRVHRVRILPGDKVKVEMTPYDLKKGRIVYRFRAEEKPTTVPEETVESA